MIKRSIYSLLVFLSIIFSVAAIAADDRVIYLDDTCTVNILNRTIQVAQDGTWRLDNVPSFMGLIRARVSCLRAGRTISGHTDFFTVPANGRIDVGEFFIEEISPVAERLVFEPNAPVNLNGIGATKQLVLKAFYAGGSNKEITDALANGVNYQIANPSIVSINNQGQLTSLQAGSTFLTARSDGVLAVINIVVTTSDDTDNDGIPDNVENSLGLNPNDPIDAFEDLDNDGLSNIDEYQLGTGLDNPDSDDDGLTDGEEVNAGDDGFITNPLSKDSDGDGIDDGVEIANGWDPTDEDSGDISRLVDSISLSAAHIDLVFNGIDTEAYQAIRVTANLQTGNTRSVTAIANYLSDDLSIASFGNNPGEIFAAATGTTAVHVEYAGKTASVTVDVTQFEPQALAAIDIPGHANNVDVLGNYAYVAAGEAGLIVVDVTDRSAPQQVALLDTNGTAVNVKVRNRTVFVADGEAGVKIIDVTDPTTPVLLSHYETAGFAQDLQVQGHYLYIADGDGGLEVVDVRDLSAPFVTSHVQGIGSVVAIEANQTHLVAVIPNKIVVFEIAADPSTLVVDEDKVLLLNQPYLNAIAIKNGYAFISSLGNPVLLTIDIEQLEVVDSGITRLFQALDVEVFGDYVFESFTAFQDATSNSIPYFTARSRIPVYQGVIDLTAFGLFNSMGLAVDNRYIYSAMVPYVDAVPAPIYGVDDAKGVTKLGIAQYRQAIDNNAQAPTIVIDQPQVTDAWAEGASVPLVLSVEDDIAVNAVSVTLDGTQVCVLQQLPYACLIDVPRDITSTILHVTASDFGDNQTVITTSIAVLADQDADGLPDEHETTRYGTDPALADTDDDGLNDGLELRLGTNALDADSDDDGQLDGEEVGSGTDPLNPDILAPEILSTMPQADATEVPESDPIHIQFNESIKLRSVTSNSIEVREATTLIGVPGTVFLHDDQRTIEFQANGLLKDYTQYQVIVKGLRDQAGNLMTAYTFNYTTGNVQDTTAPQVELVNFINNSKNVPTNHLFMMRFNEPVHPDSITSSSIYLYDNVLGQVIAARLIHSRDRREVILALDQELAVGRSHSLYFRNIKDLFGNNLSHSRYGFTTAFESDSTAPVFEGFSVPADAQDVPTNARLEVRFDEAVNTLKLSGLQLFKAGELVSVAGRGFSSDRKRVWLQLVGGLLEPNTEYTLEVSGIEDVSGNAWNETRQVSFTTGAGADLVAPTLVYREPFANGPGLRPIIEMQFSKELNPLDVHSDKVYINVLPKDQQRPVLLADGKTVRIELLEDLQPSTTYSVYYGYLRDRSNNYVPVQYTWRRNGAQYSFMTVSAEVGVDKQALQLIRTPLTDEVGPIAINSQFGLAFDDAVSYSCMVDAQIAVYRMEGGVQVESIPLELTWSSNRQSALSIKAAEHLQVSSNYELVITGLCDESGNVMADYSQVFRTNEETTADTTGPSIIESLPAADATDVSLTSTLVWTFNEPIGWYSNPLSNSYAYVNVNGQRYAGRWSLSADHRQLIYTPDQPFPAGAQVLGYLRPYYASVFDTSGNRGSTSSRSIRFTTVNDDPDVQAPSVIHSSPADNLVDINPSDSVVLTFSEALDNTTINGNNLALFANGERVDRVSISYAWNNRSVTLNPRYTLPVNAVISVVVTSDVKDISGNTLQDYISVFTTGSSDGSRPSISTIYPDNGATHVDPTRGIVLYANERLDESSLMEEGALYVSQNGRLVDGELRLGDDGYTVYFDPAQPWISGAYIEIFVRSGIADEAGNLLHAKHSVFRVRSDNTGPRLVSSSSTSNLPLNPVMRFYFDRPLDPASVGSDTVVLYRNYSSGVVPAKVSLSADGKVVSVTPEQLLTPGNYRIAGTIRDVAGIEVTLNRYYYSVPADAVEDTTTPQAAGMFGSQAPVLDANNIGVNAAPHARFNERIDVLSIEGLPSEHYTLSYSSARDEYQIIPHVPFAASSTVSFTATVADGSGNERQSVFRFSTQDGYDLSAPALRNHSPASNATNVPTSTGVSLQFSEPLSPVNASVRLYEEQTNTYLPVDIQLSADYQTLYALPQEALAVGRRYRVYYSASDMSVRNSVSTYYRFTTSFESDNTAPVFEGFSVPADAQDVPTNARLEVRFDEAVNTLKLSGLQLFKAGERVSVAGRGFSSDRKRVWLQLVGDLLAPNTKYTLEVSGIEDVSGNALDQSYQTSFTTGSGTDLARPSIVYKEPFANGAGLRPIIEMQFNELINPADVNSDVVYINQLAKDQQRPVLLADGRTVRIELLEDLQPSTNYAVIYGCVRDWGQNYTYSACPSSTTHYSFTTASAEAGVDKQALQLIGRPFTDEMGPVAVNLDTRVTFDDAVSYSCERDAQIAIYRLDGGVRGDRVPIDLTWHRSAQTILDLEVVEHLQASSDYELVITGLCDESGNVMADYSQVFRTNEETTADTTGPSIIESLPAADATDVSLTSTLVWTFNEPIGWYSNPLSNGYAYVNVNGQRYAGRWSLSADHRQMIYTPDQPFPAGAEVYGYLRPYYASVFDTSGNRGSTSSRSIRFTTVNDDPDVQAPSVIHSSPADNLVDINPSDSVVLTFSEALDNTTINGNNLALFANGERVDRVSISYAWNNRSVTLNPRYTLPVNAVISVVVTSDVKDISGNTLQDYISVFTTGSSDGSRPSISTIYPDNGATHVDPTRGIVLYANERLDESSLMEEGALYVSQNGRLVDGELRLGDDGYTVYFDPAQPWISGAYIEIFVRSGIADEAGNLLHAKHSVFRVRSDNTGPRLVSSSSTSNLPLNPVMRFYFDRPLDPASVGSDTVVLYRNYSSGVVPAKVSLSADGKVVSVTPEQLLTPGNYRIAGTIRDVAGIEVTLNRYYYSVPADAVEDTTTPQAAGMFGSQAPVLDANNIGVNAAPHARFNERIDVLSIEGLPSEHYTLSYSSARDEYQIIPHVPFAASSTVSFTATVADGSGNERQSVFRFSTQDGYDLSAPALRNHSPASNATNVPTSTGVSLQFSEPLSPVNASVRLYEEQTNTYLPVDIQLSADYQTLYALPQEALAVGRRYRVYYSASDMSVRNSVSTYYRFTTSFESDNTAPVFEGFSVPADAQDVPTNARLEVRFDEAVNTLKLSGLQLFKAGERVSVAGRGFSSDRKRVWLQLVGDLLAPNTKYTLEVSGIEDVSGNALDQSYQTSFTTGSGTDLARPSIVYKEPFANGAGLRPIIEMQFNELINPADVNSDVVYINQLAKDQQRPVLLADGRTVRIELLEDLQPSTNYAVIYGCVRDWGQNYTYSACPSSTTHYSFTTASAEAGVDKQALQLIGRPFTDEMGPVAVNLDTRVTFDDAVSYSCERDAQIAIYRLDGGVRGDRVPIDLTWHRSAQTILDLEVVEHLQASSDYELVITGLCDESGNVMADYSQVFRTNEETTADTTGPSIIESLPAADATDVSLTSTLVWTFNEPIGWYSNPLSNGYAYVNVNGQRYAGRWSLSADHRQMIYTPDQPFPAGAEVYGYLRPYYASVFDTSGNRGSTSSRSIRFTTANE